MFDTVTEIHQLLQEEKGGKGEELSTFLTLILLLLC